MSADPRCGTCARAHAPGDSEWIEHPRGETHTCDWCARRFARTVLATAILRWAAQIRAWSLPWRSGIYPGEMAALLGLCETAGIRAIVESGRGPDAYSTHCLARYAEVMGVEVVSIDWELDAAAGARVRAALPTSPRLRCVVGDAVRVFPAVARSLPGPLAVLLDGPKLRPATRLSLAAAAMFDVAVVAHHNCPLRAPWGRHFARCFPGAFHYEALDLHEQPEWRAFKRWEWRQVRGYEVDDVTHGTIGRALAFSSLALASVWRRPGWWTMGPRAGWLRARWAWGRR